MDGAVIERLRSFFAADRSLQLVYLFGSAARGEASENSDLDLAVLGWEPLGLQRISELAEETSRALGHRFRVQLVDLHTASPVLAAEVVRDGVVLREQSPEVRFDFEMAAIRRFEDTRPLRRLQHELLREAARGPT